VKFLYFVVCNILFVFVCVQVKSNVWPLFRWSFDDSFFATVVKDRIQIYDAKYGKISCFFLMSLFFFVFFHCLSVWPILFCYILCFGFVLLYFVFWFCF
jgi:hypothetical protein